MKLDRLLAILTILLQKDRVTVPYLAERFEVFQRTIGRDIDALGQAGIPVITYRGGGGGVSIAEGYKLDKSVLTANELSNIIAALNGIESVTDKSQIDQTLDKLSANKDSVVSLREPIVIDLASYNNGGLTPKIELIKQAVLEQRLIEFHYYYEKGGVHRCIEPYLVVFKWTDWYVFGYCLDREDWRLFKLSRLWELCLFDKTYVLRKIPSEKLDFNLFFSNDNKLIALFEESVKYQLIEIYGLDCFTVTSDGKLRLEVVYTSQHYIVSWLLGFGGKVRVLEPADIAEKIKQAAKKYYKAMNELDCTLSSSFCYDK